MCENNPKLVLLFCGKRKSGKDYMTDWLQVHVCPTLNPPCTTPPCTSPLCATTPTNRAVKELQ